MKLIQTFLLLTLSLPAMADTPKPVVEYASASNGYASISGALETSATEPVGITVKIGGRSYSTICNPDGKWGLVIKHTSANYSVESFNVLNSQERSFTQTFTLK